jgi:hypothetical protein
MIKNTERVLTIVLLMITLSGCSSPANEVSSRMEEEFSTAVPVTDMNKGLELKTYEDQKNFPLGSDIQLLVENKSSHFLFFDLAGNYIKLLMIREGEWVEVKDGLTGSGSRVLSPAGTPLLNLDTTWARPELDTNVFKDNENILIRIVITGEIMKMDAYNPEWREREDEILTGELVGAYVDVYVSP